MTNRHFRRFFAPACAIVLAALVLTGCGAAAKSGTMQATSAAEASASPMAAAGNGIAYARTADTAAQDGAAAKATADAAAQLPQGRKWVINMSLSAETEDLDAALAAVQERITLFGGYIESQSLNTNSTQTYRSAYMTVRIPAEQADSFVSQVGGFTNITYSSRDVTDITLTYTDTEGRITSLRTEETRLLELMEQAETVSDLLAIESRLTEVRYDLEVYTSRLRGFDNQVDYATISVFINQVEKYTPAAERSFWQRITDGLADSIADLGSAIVDGIAWLIIDLPYLLVIGAVCYAAFLLIRRRIRRHRSGKAAREE